MSEVIKVMVGKEEYEVPLQVIADFEKVRQSGKTNMFDAQAVMYYMNELGCHVGVGYLLNENYREDSLSPNRQQYDSKKLIAIMEAYEKIHQITKKLADS